MPDDKRRPEVQNVERYTNRRAAVRAYEDAIAAGFDASREGLRVTIHPTRVETIERRLQSREPASTDARTLDLIQSVLSGQEWDADTAATIANLVRDTGREVRDIES